EIAFRDMVVAVRSRYSQIKYVVPRIILLTTLTLTILREIDVLSYVIDPGGEKKLLGHKRHIEFTKRWNFLQHKLVKAVFAISHFDFNEVLYFIKSSYYDLFTELEASL
ncbi:hypothetical protein KI387_001719, partial [Taxus chinensis]